MSVACSAPSRLLLSVLPSPPQASDLVIERSAACKPKPDPSTLVFGKQFSDHMLTVDWSEKDGWEAPQIKPFQNLSLHPASSALHYSIEVSPGRPPHPHPPSSILLFTDETFRVSVSCSCLRA